MVVVAAVEGFCGRRANSFALISESFHVATDGILIAVGIVVERAMRKGGPEAKLEGRGGAVSSIFLAVAASYILFHAVERWRSPEAVDWRWMGVALLGGLVNVAQHLILKDGESHRLHHRAINFEVLSDLGQALGVVVGGIAIWGTGITLIDPLVSFGVGVCMALKACNLARDGRALLRRST